MEEIYSFVLFLLFFSASHKTSSQINPLMLAVYVCVVKVKYCFNLLIQLMFD